jgi:hypothetical protein
LRQIKGDNAMSWLPEGFALGLGRRRTGDPAGDHLRRGTELIRAAILESLDGAASADAAALARRARAAAGAERLWYLRMDLMTVLASALGEAAARGKLREINQLFQELLPGSFACHPGRTDARPSGFESR